jgi:hypothetical protein
MSASKGNSFGPIDPSLCYSLPQMAAALDMTPRNFRERYINTGALRNFSHAPNKYSIHGSAWVSYVLENMEEGGYHEEENDG